MDTVRVAVQGLELVASVCGDRAKPALVLLHGWPHCRRMFDPVLERFGDAFFTLAFDLPAVGDSIGAPPSSEKTVLADLVLAAAEQLGARRIVIAGVDVGGMTAWSAARDHSARIDGAVVMNTVIPGLDPWRAVIAIPEIWHFAFHAIPDLPELLVTGHQRTYFDWFIDTLAGTRTAISDELRNAFAHAYDRPAALKAGFDWYRAFAADAARNGTHAEVTTPVLYLRGDAQPGSIDDYVDGLRRGGAQRLTSRTLAHCGEYLPQEAPDALVDAIHQFAAGLH